MNKVIAVFVGLSVVSALALAPMTAEARDIASYKHYIAGKGNVKKGPKPAPKKVTKFK